MIKRVPIIHWFAMVLLLLSPLLGIYGNPNGWSFSMILSIPLSIFFFVSYTANKKSVFGPNNPLPYGLLPYYLYWGLALTIIGLSLPITVIQSYLLFFLFFATFHFNYYIKLYEPFALICIAFFFIQEVSYIVTGSRVSGIIPSLPLYDVMNTSELINFQLNSERSCSFFREPAHLAQFLLPLLAIELFHNNHKYHIVYACLIGITLLFLQSGNGLLGLAIILLFIPPFYLSNNRRRLISNIVILIVIIVVGYYYINSEIGSSVMERQSELSAEYEGGSASGFLRVWRGFYVYGDYNLLEKIFGCPGSEAQLAHVKASGMLMVSSAELYFNAFQKVLLNTGLIGVALFIIIIVHLWRGNSICGKAILSSFIGLSFVAAIYMSNTMILYLLLAYNLKKKNLVGVH